MDPNAYTVTWAEEQARISWTTGQVPCQNPGEPDHIFSIRNIGG